MKLSLSPFCHCVTRKREPSDLEEVFAALAHASRRQILLVLKFHGGRMSCEFLALANPLYQSSDGSGQALMEAILRTDTTYLLQVTTDSPAFANTITFETAPFGFFHDPVTENGLTYSTLSGGLVMDEFGNPRQDMHGASAPIFFTGGVVKIVSATGGNFHFTILILHPSLQSPAYPTHSRSKGFLADRSSEWINLRLLPVPL